MVRCCRFWFALLCALSFAATVNAAKQTDPESPTIVTESHEVSLDLVVRDRHGRIVDDLKPSDLKILDAGSPVKISYIGRSQRDAATPDLVVLYLDRLDNPAGKNARDIVAKLLKSAPRVPVEYAVFGVGGRLRLFQNFTKDAEAVKTAVRVVSGGARIRDPQHLDTRAEQAILNGAQTLALPVEETALNRVVSNALREAQRSVTEQHASPVYGGLLAVARAMREAPGRKTIIFFSEGQPTGPNVGDTMQAIVGAANRAGVSIYVVDSNSLDNGVMQGLQVSLAMASLSAFKTQNPAPTGPTAPPDITTPGQKSMASEQYGRIENQGLSGQQTALDMLAHDTSGAYISLAQNPKRAFQRMFEDMATYYQVTYVPPEYEEDGRFRKVVVTPVRKHVNIVARSGYYAVPPRSGSRPFETPLLKMLRNEQLPSDLTFCANILRLGALPTGDENALVVEAPMEQAEFVQDAAAQRYSAHLSIVSQLKTPAGMVVEKFSDDVLRHGDLDLLDRARTEVVTMARHFSEPPGEYILETVIMDRNTGRAGGSRSRFVIPKETTGPQLSDLMMVRRQLPYNPEVDPDEPLRYDKSTILPNVSRQIPKGTGMLSFFLLIHPDATNTTRPRLEMELRREGQPLLRQPLRITAGSVDATIPYLATIHSAQLPNGHYSMAAILTQGQEVSERSVSFQIGNPAPVVADANPFFPMPVPPQYVDVNSLQIERADSVPPLDADAANELLQHSRDRALSYLNSLPNFLCVERTERSVDPSGLGRWHHKDDFAELLRYRDKQEHRVMLEANGHKTELERSDLKGTVSVGEFGGLFVAVFRPEAHASFAWKSAATIGNSLVEVFSYTVDRAHSDFTIQDDTGAHTVAAYHGLVYLDETTKDIRRITLESSDVPDTYAIRSTGITVDYDYVPIGGHDFLMPVSGVVSASKGERGSILNEIQFRDYRKYGAESALRFE